MQLAVEADELFSGVLSDLEVTVDYNPDGEDPIQTIFDYVEAMRCSLWDIAFFREFKVSQQVHKNNTIDKQPNFYQALRRVLYRYFKYILLPKKAISKVPPFFPNYLEPTSDECMYTPAMMKAWESCHYERCGWYMDCPVMKPPLFDVALRDSLQPALSKLVLPPPPEPVPQSSDLTKAGSTKAKASAKVVKRRGAKRKAIDLVEEPVDDDIVAIAAIDPLAPSTEDPISPVSKRPNLHSSEEATLKSLIPPKIKSMSLKNPSSSSSLGSEVLILNDSFPDMLEFKAKSNNNKFPPTYDALVAFLTKVPLYFTSRISFICLLHVFCLLS